MDPSCRDVNPRCSLLARLSQPQWDFCADVESTAVLLSGGYGAGKSMALTRKAFILAAENPGCWIGVVGPIWRQLQRDMVELFEQGFAALGLVKGRHWFANKNDATMQVPAWGWRFALASGDNPDSLKGPTWGAACVNEPGIQDERVWEVVFSRVRDARARLRQTCLAGTPEGFNWLWERFVNKPKPGYRVIYTRTSDNPACPAGYEAGLARDFDAKLAEEKIHGRFVNVRGGLAYYCFDRVAHVRDLEADPALPLLVALDFNVDPFTALIIQQAGDETRVVDEVVLSGVGTPEMAAALAARVAPQVPASTIVYPDASGAARRTAGASDFTLLAEAGFENLSYSPANPAVRDRVNAVNGRLRNALGAVRVVISPRCGTLIRDMEQVVWKSAELDKRNTRLTHASDALGYYIAREFPVGGQREGGIVA